MVVSSFIEKYFWLFLSAGIAAGLLNPFPFSIPPYLPEILLGLMLFLVFLKIDTLEIIENIRNYKLMIYVVSVYMLILPVLFFYSVKLFDHELAIGILLLTAMPAGVSSPALTDIVKGNVSLSMSLAISSQMVAPFTVPLLFWFIDMDGLSINKLSVFKDISLVIFLPMIVSIIIKRYFRETIRMTQHLFTSANVLVLFTFVFVAISSQRNAILENPVSLLWKIAILYLVFILLHVAGYMICLRSNKENRIAVAIGAAYMNNGMAIVLAASYFKPEILILMVLSELPWNTLLEPFKRVVGKL